MSRRSVPGFDCTFRPPKSVSLLYGLGDLSTSVAVREADEAAAAAGVGYLETHAGFCRRGHDGSERVPVTAVVAAGFRHRTSRAGDPLLHTHVLVAILGRAAGRRRPLADPGRPRRVCACQDRRLPGIRRSCGPS